MECESLQPLRCLSDLQVTSEALAEKLADVHAHIDLVLVVLADTIC